MKGIRRAGGGFVTRALRLALPLGLVLAAVPLLRALAADVGEQVTVTLVGGAKVTGMLLRDSDQGVALDLGHDVVSIPRDRVLDVTAVDGEAPAAEKADKGVFTTGRLEAVPVPELVKRLGDAVVMIKTARGLGSGFITSARGHLVTNYHVVEGETKIIVTVFRPTEQGYEKRELKKAKIIALHPLRDLALLELDREELDGQELKPLVINSEDDLRVGDLVFAIGNPLGLERTVTQGIISSVTRTLGHVRLIQTDVSINPGNSGGPLFNARGEVVGVACAGHVVFDGLAFGVPANDLVDFLVHRESYLYDPSQPQNGVTYLPPPYRGPDEPKKDEP
ncbi:MAG: trypsin-like peptidase domain-containing protein [Planctomycetes bacterium]|nr:trypsin-like peptidase domain-containing protein [Planctomycetota bacterium]